MKFEDEGCAHLLIASNVITGQTKPRGVAAAEPFEE